jgi:hypothetical protein
MARERRRLAALNTTFRRLSSGSRVLPSFLVLGAQKAGTTSLFELLAQHPQVQPPRLKEVNFFDKDWSKGLDHYRSVFPRNSEMSDVDRTFDNTPSYLYQPRVPKRVLEVVPDARFVVLLRNPTDRAYSHYLHAKALGRETLSFEEGLAAEGHPPRADDRQPVDLWAAAQNLAYVARGRYIDQLERWWAHFPRDRFLLLKSEDFFADPVAALDEIAVFVGLERFVPADVTPRNQSRGPALDPAIRASLDERFAHDNARLLAATGIDLG